MVRIVMLFTFDPVSRDVSESYIGLYILRCDVVLLLIIFIILIQLLEGVEWRLVDIMLYMNNVCDMIVYCIVYSV